MKSIALSPSIFALAACGMESPSGLQPTVSVLDLSDRGKPSFITFSAPPVVQNGPVVWAALELEYAPLRAAGLFGRTIVGLRLDQTGVVQDVEIDESSGQPALDDVALRVARQIAFSPATNKNRPVSVQVAIPIQFQERR